MTKIYRKGQIYTDTIDKVNWKENRIIHMGPKETPDHINFGSIDANEGDEVTFVYKGGNEAELVTSNKSNNPLVGQKRNRNDLVNDSL